MNKKYCVLYFSLFMLPTRINSMIAPYQPEVPSYDIFEQEIAAGLRAIETEHSLHNDALKRIRTLFDHQPQECELLCYNDDQNETGKALEEFRSCSPVTLDDIERQNLSLISQLEQERETLSRSIGELTQEIRQIDNLYYPKLATGALGTAVGAYSILRLTQGDSTQDHPTRSILGTLSLVKLGGKIVGPIASVGLAYGGYRYIRNLIIASYERKKIIPKLEEGLESLNGKFEELQQQQDHDRAALKRSLDGLMDGLAIFSDQVRELGETNSNLKALVEGKIMPAMATMSTQVDQVKNLTQKSIGSESGKSVRSSFSALFRRHKEPDTREKAPSRLLVEQYKNRRGRRGSLPGIHLSSPKQTKVTSVPEIVMPTDAVLLGTTEEGAGAGDYEDADEVPAFPRNPSFYEENDEEGKPLKSTGKRKYRSGTLPGGL